MVYSRSTNDILLSISMIREVTWQRIIDGAMVYARLSSVITGDLSGDEWEEDIDREHGDIDDSTVYSGSDADA